MRLHFCTLFDSNFLISGYTMYTSLQKHCKDFHLYIFAFDDLAYDALNQMTLLDTTIIPLSEFEDEELLRVKPTRNKGEYCWTCTPSTIRYCIEKYDLDHCTYLDADIFFYDNPDILFEELVSSNKDVLITSHNYAKQYDQSSESGIYCVQFMIFKHTSKGMEVLNWWRNACIDWCFDRQEDGKFGDQKYLDEWPTRYDCIYISKQLGAGVAPWNACSYHLINKPDNKFYVKTVDNAEFKLIFYHFHALRLYKNIIKWGTGYFLTKDFKECIYKPYTKQLQYHYQFINRVIPRFYLSINVDFQPLSKRLKIKLFFKDILLFFYFKYKKMQFRPLFNTYYIYKLEDAQFDRS